MTPIKKIYEEETEEDPRKNFIEKGEGGVREGKKDDLHDSNHTKEEKDNLDADE